MVVCIQPTVDSIISMIDNIIIRLTGLFPPTEARYKPFNESRQSDWDYLENQDSYRSRKDRCKNIIVLKSRTEEMYLIFFFSH